MLRGLSTGATPRILYVVNTSWMLEKGYRVISSQLRDKITELHTNCEQDEATTANPFSIQLYTQLRSNASSKTVSHNENISFVRSLGYEPVPCCSCVSQKPRFAGFACTISKPTIVDSQDIGTQSRRELLIVLDTPCKRTSGTIAMEEENGWI